MIPIHFVSFVELEGGFEVFIDPREIAAIEAHDNSVKRVVLKNGSSYRTTMSRAEFAGLIKEIGLSLKIADRKKKAEGSS